MQNPDCRITVSMDEYVKSKLRPIEVPKGYLSNTKEISDGMLTNVKGVNGGLGWLASTARPDMAAPHSIIPPQYDRRSTTIDFRSQRGSETIAHAVPINIHDLAHSSLRSYVGRAIQRAPTRFDTGVCHKQVLQPGNVSAPVSVLHWRSRKLTRKAGSPQLVETYAASSAVVEMTWIKAL